MYPEVAPGDRLDARHRRRLRRLFFGLAALYLLPLLAAPYLPTTDGPSHTYNAWILRQLGNEADYPRFAEHYEANLRPYPNWGGHAVLLGLMYAVPPVAAEKLLAGGCVLLLVGGVWYLARSLRPGDPWPVLLAFPFAYNRFFAYGFYNFSLGVAAALFTIGFWWRRREQLDLRSAVGVNALLWVCWFCHLFCFGMALLAIAVLWAATLRPGTWRRHLLHVPLLAPQVLLPIWFLRVQGGGPEAVQSSFAELLDGIVRPKILHSYSGFQLTLANVLAAVLLALLLLTLHRTFSRRRVAGDASRDDSPAFLVLLGAILALYFWGLEGIARGSLMTGRASLFFYLVLIAWLAPGLAGPARRLAIALLATIAVANVAYLTRWYSMLGEEVRRFVAGLETVPADTRVMTLLFRRYEPTAGIDYTSHSTAYAAIAKGLVDWDNYEAKEPHFPVRFRNGVELPDIERVHVDPAAFRPSINRPTVDAVYTWQMPSRHPLRRRLRISGYEQRSEIHGGEVFVRRDAPPRAAEGERRPREPRSTAAGSDAAPRRAGR